MKYLLIIFLSFNVYADIKKTVTCERFGTFHKNFKTQLEADAWVADNISNNSWGKPEGWERFESQTTCITIEDVYTQVNDISVEYPDPIPDGYIHPQVSIVDYQRCRMPVEYTITQTDITQDVLDAKEKKDEDDARKLEIKNAAKIRPLTQLEMSDYIKLQMGL